MQNGRMCKFATLQVAYLKLRMCFMLELQASRTPSKPTEPTMFCRCPDGEAQPELQHAPEERHLLWAYRCALCMLLLLRWVPARVPTLFNLTAAFWRLQGVYGWRVGSTEIWSCTSAMKLLVRQPSKTHVGVCHMAFS